MMSQETSDKIDSFGKLPKGWHFGEGIPAGEKVMAVAKELSQMTQLDTNVFPGVSGAIALTFYKIPRFLEVYIEADGSFEVSEENGVGVNYEIVSESEEVDLEGAKAKIIAFEAK